MTFGLYLDCRSNIVAGAHTILRDIKASRNSIRSSVFEYTVNVVLADLISICECPSFFRWDGSIFLYECNVPCEVRMVFDICSEYNVNDTRDKVVAIFILGKLWPCNEDIDLLFVLLLVSCRCRTEHISLLEVYECILVLYWPKYHRTSLVARIWTPYCGCFRNSLCFVLLSIQSLGSCRFKDVLLKLCCDVMKLDCTIYVSRRRCHLLTVDQCTQQWNCVLLSMSALTQHTFFYAIILRFNSPQFQQARFCNASNWD